MQIKTARLGHATLADMHAASLAPTEPAVDLPATARRSTGDAHAGASSDAAFRMLDEPLEWAAFSQASADDPHRVVSHLVIDGIQCSACAAAIERVLKATPGVLDAEVSAASRRARVVWSSTTVLPSRWLGAIRKAGYQPLPAIDSRARAIRLKESRAALWRWLVAGLCMMQVMMYAYPAYVALPGDLSSESERLLRWASWVLTLPVLLFSSGPFFRSAWRDLQSRRVGMDLPVAIALLITFAVSSAGTFDPQGAFGREVYFDSLTMFVFFLLTGRWLEQRLRARSAGSLEAMLNRLPDVVQRRRVDGSFEAVPVSSLALGDLLRVLPGEAIAADGVIVRGATQVDQALLTGESRPVQRDCGATVIAGSFNLSGVIELRVEKIGADTRYAAIQALVQSAASAKPRLARLADRIAKPFLIVVLLAAAAAAGFWWSAGPAQALMVAVAVLIVTCPCALSLATPAAMLAAAGRLARAGVLVRRLQAFEALAQVDLVVFDKTGTLTRDGLRLSAVTVRDGLSRDQALGMAAALARQSLHPVAKALVGAVDAAGGDEDWQVADLAETAGAGLAGTLTRVAADLPPMALRLGNCRFCELPVSAHTAGATHLVDVTGWLASFSLQQDLRPDAAATVAQLQQAGIAVHMLSGDQLAAAHQVATALGIGSVLAACTPDDKLAFVRAQQALGHSVAMVGDGLNDAPVLAASDVSFAMGHAAALSQSQADFVVQGGQLQRIAQSLALARHTMRIVRQNLAWALAYNMACIPLALMGLIPAWLAGLGMAASSLLVVGNAMRLSAALPGDAA